MSETYEITYDAASVGTAQVKKQGLYLLLSCRCSLPDEGLYRIHACYGCDRMDLGICVPMGEVFGMDKKIPLKQIPEGTPSFFLLPKDWKPEEPVEIEPAVPVTDEAEAPITDETELPVTAEAEEFETSEEEEKVTLGTGETFIPVTEDEPFEYLDKLEGAHMEVHDGVSGIVIAE